MSITITPDGRLWNTALPGHKYFASIGAMWFENQLIGANGQNELSLYMHAGFGVDSYNEININSTLFPKSWQSMDVGRAYTANLWHPRDIVIYHLQLTNADLDGSNVIPLGVSKNELNQLKLRFAIKNGTTTTSQNSHYSIYVKNGDVPLQLTHDTYYLQNNGTVSLDSVPNVLSINNFIKFGASESINSSWADRKYSFPTSVVDGLFTSISKLNSVYIAFEVDAENPRPTNAAYDNNIEIGWVSVQS